MKPCRYCEKEFIPNRDWQLDCSRECHYQYWKRQNRLSYKAKKELKTEPKSEPVAVQ